MNPKKEIFRELRGRPLKHGGQTLARLDRVHEEFIRAIAALPDTALKQTLPGKPYTTQFMLEGAVRHHVYHAGQVALLRNALCSSGRK
jgi:hypothetical protein